MRVNPNVTRRTFLTWYMAGLMTATVVAALAPILVFIWAPPPKGQKQGEIEVGLQDSLNSLQELHALAFQAPQNTAFVMADGGGDNAAGDLAYTGYAIKVAGKIFYFASNCSHLGCSIQWQDSDQRFHCPCHGSQFHADGSVAHGPALFPLSHLSVTSAQDKTLKVKGYIYTAAS
jgi:cytochrome b6-f complex iron-sulfur subunit